MYDERTNHITSMFVSRGSFAELRFEKIGKKIKKWKVLSLAKQEAQWVILLTALADRKDLGGF